MEKKAQGVAAEETHWAQAVVAALLAVRAHLPAMAGAALQMVDDPAGAVEGHRRKVSHFEPEFGKPSLVAHLKTLFKVLSHLAAASAGMAIDMNGARAGPGPEIAEREDAAYEVGEVEGERAPTVEREAPGGDESGKQEDEA